MFSTLYQVIFFSNIRDGMLSQIIAIVCHYFVKCLFRNFAHGHTFQEITVDYELKPLWHWAFAKQTIPLDTGSFSRRQCDCYLDRSGKKSTDLLFLRLCCTYLMHNAHFGVNFTNKNNCNFTFDYLPQVTRNVPCSKS